MNFVSYMIHHEIKDISKVKQNNEIYGRPIFLKKKKEKKKKSKSYSTNHNPTCVKIQYKNSNSLENSIDNYSMQMFIFSLRLLFVTKEKKNSPSKISHSSHWGECSLPLNVIWETLPVVIYDQNFVKSS